MLLNINHECNGRLSGFLLHNNNAEQNSASFKVKQHNASMLNRVLMITNAVCCFHPVGLLHHPRTLGYRGRRQWNEIKQLWTLESDRLRVNVKLTLY